MSKKSLVALMLVLALLLVFAVAMTGCKSKTPNDDTAATTTTVNGQDEALGDNEINLEDIFPVKTSYVTVTDDKGAPVTTYVNVTDAKGTTVTTYVTNADGKGTTVANVTTAVVVTSVHYELEDPVTTTANGGATTTTNATTNVTTTTTTAAATTTVKTAGSTANIGFDDNKGWSPLKPIG